MKEKKNIIKKGEILQKKIEKRISKLPKINASNWFLFFSIVFILMGIILFFYMALYDINIWKVGYLECPLLYLILGFVCLIGKYWGDYLDE